MKAIVLSTARDCNTTWCVDPLALSTRVAGHSTHPSMIPCWSGPTLQDSFLAHPNRCFTAILTWPSANAHLSSVRTGFRSYAIFQASFEVLEHVEEFVVVQRLGRIGVGW